MPRNTSPHVFNASTNLLGFCLVVLTSLHVTDRTEHSIVDEVTSLVILLLTLSCLFSFLSIRANEEKKQVRFERLADVLFFACLTGIFLVVAIIITRYW